jgi:hypothetical protein
MNRYHTTIAVLACALLPLAMLSVPQKRDTITDQIDDMAITTGVSRVAHGLYRDWLHQGTQQYVGFELSAGVHYHLLGACDDDCADLHFLLVAPDGSPQGQLNGTGSRPTVSLDAPVTGRYQLRATMRQCRLQPCEWGVRVYRR